ncbi:MAG: hypothetical protein IT385_03615 [Deltaproteobacteria bacterium]|nr:hypothetical protein [Deltaproteobacteria bacterium]
MSLAWLAGGAGGCGGKAPEEAAVDKEAWVDGLGVATARALQMGDIEALRPFLPNGRDCGITSQVDAYQLGRWTCAVSKLDEGFTKPFFEAVKALAQRPIMAKKPFARIAPDPDAEPGARSWQRRLELVYDTPELKVGVFWTLADFEGRYLIVGPPVVGKPSM